MPSVRQAALVLLCSALAGSAFAWPGQALADPPGRSKPVTVGRICAIIEREADRQGLPRDFFARLIFKESRFDPGAVSPAGAEGIAQFMPGTALMRGLDDSFDIDKALPASAKYLGELKTGFGNLGLAAAAYNAGEARVTRWLSSGGFLPLETENYVLDIMGEPADVFTDAKYAGTVQPLHPHAEVRRRLPQAARDHERGRGHVDGADQALGCAGRGQHTACHRRPPMAACQGALPRAALGTRACRQPGASCIRPAPHLRRAHWRGVAQGGRRDMRQAAPGRRRLRRAEEQVAAAVYAVFAISVSLSQAPILALSRSGDTGFGR